MKVKKDIHHVLFFDLFFGTILIVLMSLGFFLGFELVEKNVLIYLASVLCVIATCVTVFLIYKLFCTTYFVFSDDEILLVKKKQILKHVPYVCITAAQYFKFHNLLLGDSKGGKLIVNYVEDNEQNTIEISLTLKKVKRLPIIGIVMIR